MLGELYPATDAAMCVYFGLPLSVVLGIFIADWRARWLYIAVPSRLTSPYELEIKVGRARLPSAMAARNGRWRDAGLIALRRRQPLTRALSTDMRGYHNPRPISHLRLPSSYALSFIRRACSSTRPSGATLLTRRRAACRRFLTVSSTPAQP